MFGNEIEKLNFLNKTQLRFFSNSICHYPNRSSNDYFEEQRQLTKRRSVSQNLPDPTLLEQLKDIVRTLQKSLSSALNVSDHVLFLGSTPRNP